MNIFQSVTKMATDAGTVMASAASQTGKAVFQTSVEVGETISNTASQAS